MPPQQGDRGIYEYPAEVVQERARQTREMHAENQRLKAEVERLRKALDTFGAHFPGCDHFDFKDCTCGFADALALGREEPSDAT